MADGLNLMLFGMGTVFVFLTALVVCTNLMSVLIMRFYPETLAPATAPRKDSQKENSRIIAVIEAAVAEHRKSK
jgi:oxaloacetate decarboxylase gamma subunit